MEYAKKNYLSFTTALRTIHNQGFQVFVSIWNPMGYRLQEEADLS